MKLSEIKVWISVVGKFTDKVDTGTVKVAYYSCG